MLNVNSQLKFVNNQNSENMFKPKFIIRPRKRYRFKDIQQRYRYNKNC